MIFSYHFLLLLLLFVFINANEQYHIGIINHNIQWYIHCPQNNTRIINPPINDQPLIPYQCPYPSLSIDILPIEVDFTFICRLQSRLIWIIVDLYQYDLWPWSINIQQLNISIKLNQNIQIKDYKRETTNYTNRFIIINAFYIPFESFEILSNEKIEISIKINQCSFYITDNSTWNDIIHKKCNSSESKTLYVQHSYCDFFPNLIPTETHHELQVEIFDDTTTHIPDFNVILSVDEQQTIESTTLFTDYHSILDEHHRKLLSTLVIIRKNWNLLIYIFIFTIVILILLIIFFITQSNYRRCLGIYTFDKNFKTKENLISIRQLALVDDFEEKYSNITECILDVDKTGTNLLCRCNSNNCTLKWKTAENLNQKFYLKHKLIKQYEYNNCIIIIIMIMKYKWYKKTYEKDDRSFLANISCASTNISNTEIDEFLSSNPTYQSIISHGKNSIIYRAWTTEKDNLQHEKKLVAVKVYHSQQYKNIFENEVQILRMIDHSAIVNFISHGWHDLCPYILLEYYNLDSLNNYLHSHKLSWSICYSFFASLLNAIDYLHYEDLLPNDYLTSNRIRKPIIIHRDIKSSNILIKSNPTLSLCLSDFGLAKILPPILTPNDFIQIGTYRYMAPELLELAITHTSDALCKVDMYAVGLVLWEIVTQCQDYSCSIDYQLPYAEYINTNEMNENKILDTLHRIVVNERKRPIIHRTINMNSKISDVLTIIEDCWKHEPESRINARPALYRLRHLE
ncbi:unnamed protein product [Rotaria sp. Silwood1]|nr:unnamed protein product [Rotaria sp. Silwood1]